MVLVLFFSAHPTVFYIPVGNARVRLGLVFAVRGLDVIRQFGLERAILTSKDDADHWRITRIASEFDSFGSGKVPLRV